MSTSKWILFGLLTAVAGGAAYLIIKKSKDSGATFTAPDGTTVTVPYELTDVEFQKLKSMPPEKLDLYYQVMQKSLNNLKTNWPFETDRIAKQEASIRKIEQYLNSI